MSRKISETEAVWRALKTQIDCIEAFLELRYGYTTMTGQNLMDQRERKKQLRAEATKQRLEKETLPPLINIHSVHRRFGEPGLICRFEDLRREGGQLITGAVLSQEAADRLQQGDTSEFHLVQLSRGLGNVLAMSSEVQGLPQKYEARVIEDKPIEVQVDADAFEKY